MGVCSEISTSVRRKDHCYETEHSTEVITNLILNPVHPNRGGKDHGKWTVKSSSTIHPRTLKSERETQHISSREKAIFTVAQLQRIRIMSNNTMTNKIR